MSLFNHTINQAKYEDIERHLIQCSKLFSPALDTYVSIPNYSKKIRENAVTVEAWHSDELIGLVACYLNNDRTREGYITNVSVIHDYQGRGIAKNLIKNTIEEALNKNFKTLNLEVEVDNKWAIDLYRQSGFVLNGRLGSKYLMINRLLENKDVMVSICCVTYNHVKYFRNAIESFLMQKTDFPIEILIHDDASTDGTADIIREYEEKHPDIIKPILQEENQYSKGETISTTYQFPRALGKYIAMCEGDDYWTDSYKLQKQVDFLENNSEYGLVHTELDHFYVSSGKYERNHWEKTGVTDQSGDLYDSLLGGGKSMIYGCTACFRRELILDINSKKFSKYMAGDVALWLHISAKSKIGYINESTAVRNVLHFSVTQGRDFNYKLKFIQSSLHVFNDYNSIRPFSKEAAYNFKQRYSRNICDLCYQFRQKFDLFEENYKQLDHGSRTLNLRLKRVLFKYRINKFISKVILKITNALFPFKTN